MFKKLFMISCIFTMEGYSAAAEPPPGGGEAAPSGQEVYPSLPASSYRNIFGAAEKGDMNAVQEFIGQGADPKAGYHYGDTVLHFAAKSGNLPLVQYLVDLGADPKAVDVYGRTVLHIAAWSGNLTLVQYLVVLGADPKAVNLYGYTVLHEAALSSNLSLVQYLVDKGLDPKAVTPNGSTVLYFAASNSHLDVAVYLADLGAPIPPEYRAQINTHRQRIKQQTSSSIKNSVMRKSLARQDVMNPDLWQNIYSFIDPRGLTMSQLISGRYIKPGEVDEWDQKTDEQRDEIKTRVQATLREQYLMQRLEHHRRNNAAKEIQRIGRGHQVRIHMREGE